MAKKISLLHCTTEYPAPLEELNLNVINTLSKKYKASIGYSDHSNNLITPIIATSQLSTSLNSGNLAKVEGPANLGTFVPLTGCIGVLSFFFFIKLL